jgi:uncharacterized protein (DUF2235 family)
VSKNIVICCDGTANQFAADNTNVVKLYSTLIQDQPSQCTFYHPGIGTMEPPGALTPLRRRLTRLLGLALGSYLENDIRDAYAFLMQSFQPGDKVFLFGFSRGAYTVRAVASLLHIYGLLRPGNEPMVAYAIRMMTAVRKARDKNPAQYKKMIDGYFDLAAQFKETMGRECRPWFVGVWDTVSSVGWIDSPLALPFTADNPEIEIGRHAVALDEHRAFFRSNLWRPGTSPHVAHGPKDLVQVWFPGVHCDVGGGYPESESGLSKLALEWMLDEAESHGLMVDDERKRAILGGTSPHMPPDPNGLMHESLTGAWRIAEYIPKKHFDVKRQVTERRANRFRRRTVPAGSLIHWSVYARKDDYAASLNLPADVKVVASKGPDRE